MSDPLTIFPQPIGVTPATQVQRRNSPKVNSNGVSFDQLLQDKINQGNVRFSRHASERMQTRGIEFDSSQLQRLETAVSRANAKGCRESLVMLDDTALVVSVKNDTVVTVVDREQMKNNVFTNIDSAVIA